MKFKIEFEMKQHSCYECPLLNGGDLCNLLLDNDYEDIEEQFNDCPLKEIKDGTE